MGLLLFKKCYWDAIVRGQKRTTIRRWSHARLRAGTRAFAGPGVGWVMVDAVDPITLASMTDDDARADGFRSRAQMLRALRAHYPDARRDGKRWFRIAFRVVHHRDA